MPTRAATFRALKCRSKLRVCTISHRTITLPTPWMEVASSKFLRQAGLASSSASMACSACRIEAFSPSMAACCTPTTVRCESCRPKPARLGPCSARCEHQAADCGLSADRATAPERHRSVARAEPGADATGRSGRCAASRCGHSGRAPPVDADEKSVGSDCIFHVFLKFTLNNQVPK